MQMNYFDRHLESELRRLLDPVVKAPAPPRRRGRRVHVLEEANPVELTFVTPIPVPVEAFA